MVKNPPAVQEVWVRSLCWEDPLEEGMGTHCKTLAWRILMDRGACWASVHGLQRVGHDCVTKHSTHPGRAEPQIRYSRHLSMGRICHPIMVYFFMVIKSFPW